MDEMKILIISTLYPPYLVGGAEKAAAELAEALARCTHEVVVITLYPGSEEVIENRNGVRVYRLPVDNVYWPFGRSRKPDAISRLAWHIREMWNPRAAGRVGRILDSEKPDVVNTHNISGFSLAIWREIKSRRLHLVHTLHDYYLLCARGTLFRRGRNCEIRCLGCRALTLNRRRLAQLPDSIVSVSRYALQEHLKNNCFQNQPTSVIFNIQGGFKSPALKIQGRTCATSDLIFGFIGKIERQKGIETLLEATRLLQSRYWRLRLAGKGSDKYVDELGRRFTDTRIEWLGFTDAEEFYASVHVVVIPSLWAEPLPYVCVESIHAGKSLICASSGGLQEIARLSEVVEFFPAGDANALAEKMNLAITSPRFRNSSVPEKARLAPFQEQYVVAKYLEEYTPSQNSR